MEQRSLTDSQREELASLLADEFGHGPQDGPSLEVVRTLKESPHEVTQLVRVVDTVGIAAQVGPRADDARGLDRTCAPGQRCVLKRIRGDAGLGGAYAALQQAQQAGHRLGHLPRVLGRWRGSDGWQCVLLEYVDGQTLADYVGERTASLELAARVFPALCDAVIELHEGLPHPLVHRDLKPSNVIVDPRCGRVVIIDLGIAREHHEGVQTDTAHFGTRGYAPPDQFGFGQTDTRTDVYALGMLLRFCLTGREPAQAGQGVDATTPPHAQAACGHRRSEAAVGRVIERACAFDPAARYQSVRELRGAFVRAIGPGLARMASAEGLVEARPESPEGADRPRGAGGVPTWLGRAWNVLLVLAMLFMLLAVTESTFGDIPALEGYPTWFRAISYFGLVYLNLCSLACLALDKRRLARRLPFLDPRAARARHRAMLVVLGVTVLTFLLGSMVAMTQMGMLTE